MCRIAPRGGSYPPSSIQSQPEARDFLHAISCAIMRLRSNWASFQSPDIVRRQLLGQRGGIGTASAGSLPNGIASLQGLFQPHARIGEAATGQSGSAGPPVTCIASLEASPVGRDRSGGWPAIEFPGSTPRHAVAGGIRGYDGVHGVKQFRAFTR